MSMNGCIFIGRSAKNLDYKTYFSYNPLRKVPAYLAYCDSSAATASQREYNFAAAFGLGMDDNALRKIKRFINSYYQRVNMKKLLENIVNSAKEVGRTIKEHGFKIATAVILPFVFSYNAGAGEIKIYNWSYDAGADWMTIKHVEGAQEGWDPDDFPHSSGPDPLQIYSNNPNHNPNELRVDARGPNSTTTFHTELYNNGGFPGFADNHLRFVMLDANDWEWKNMFLGGANDSNNIVCDVKYTIVNGSIYPDGTPYGDIDLPDVQGSKTGVYDKRKVPIFNHADLNRDRKVDFVDWAIYANAHKEGRIDIEKGSNPNALEDYADIENFYDANGVMVSYGNGTADANDMSLFMSEWLWFADDANTW